MRIVICWCQGRSKWIQLPSLTRRRRTNLPILASILAFAVILCSAEVHGAPDDESAQSLRVRAQSRINVVSVVADADHSEIRARLVDDLDVPIAGADVVVEFSGASAVAAHGCSGHAAPERSASGWVVATDDNGSFCIRSGVVERSTRVKARYAGDAYHDAVEQPILLEAQRLQVRLSFDAPVVEADLGRQTFSVWCAASAEQANAIGTPLQVVLFHRAAEAPEKLVELAKADDVPVGGRRLFDIETRKLGSPGTGTLIARHLGSGGTAVVETTAVINRTALVSLSLAGKVVPVTPGEELELRLGAASPVGAVPEGWVEAIVEGQSIAIAPISAGASALSVRLEAPRAGQVSLTLRYVPKDLWWVPGEPIVVTVPIESPAWWTRLPWLVAVAAIAYWITRSWRRPGRIVRGKAQPVPARGKAGIVVVEPGAAKGGIWGQVGDAHDGDPIAGARVRVVLPTFTGEGVAGMAITDENGRFTLSGSSEERFEGARLEVTAQHHSRLSRDLPGPGQVLISLVSRRRALLERLVSWARIRGRPWAAATDPTPGHVIAIAQRERHEAALQWARAVEEAAYGPTAPDEGREDEVMSREPGPVQQKQEER